MKGQGVSSIGRSIDIQRLHLANALIKVRNENAGEPLK